jgi:hypothetical protein
MAQIAARRSRRTHCRPDSAAAERCLCGYAEPYAGGREPVTHATEAPGICALQHCPRRLGGGPLRPFRLPHIARSLGAFERPGPPGRGRSDAICSANVGLGRRRSALRVLCDRLATSETPWRLLRCALCGFECTRLMAARSDRYLPHPGRESAPELWAAPILLDSRRALCGRAVSLRCR